MYKNVLMLLIACVLCWGVVSIAEDRMPVKDEVQKQFDKNKDGFIDGKELTMLRKFEQAREKIEKLRVMAREAEEKARQFMAEAEELQRNMEREFELPPAAPQMEQMNAKLTELKEAAERAEQEGQHDKAAQLREKAKGMAKEIEIHQQELQEGKRIEPKEQLGRLEKMAREAEERGEKDKARNLRAEAKKLERDFAREPGQRERAGQIKEVQARLAELREAAQRAQREGRLDEATELRKEAEELERGLRKLPDGKEKMAPERDLIRQIEMLREEVGRLRKDVDTLKRLAEQKR